MARNGEDHTGELDEITIVATRVLADLESFFDTGETTEWLSDAEDPSGINHSSIEAGISLDELQLILDTSIQRHCERLRPKPSVPPTREAHSVGSSSERQVKSALKIPRRGISHHHIPHMTGGLQEMHEVLRAKREQFARVRTDNRSTNSRRRGRMVDSGSQYDREQVPFHEDSVSHGYSIFSPDETMASHSRKTRATIHNNTMDPVKVIPVREEKGCNVSPLDLGPSEMDLIEVQAPDRSSDISSRRCRDRDRASIASSHFSSSFSSRSHSSSSYASSASTPSLPSQDESQAIEADETNQRNGSCREEKDHERHEDEGWELDLSNFTL